MNSVRPSAGVRFSAGIIAAGDGSRLRAAYPAIPKPLVPVRGKPLIHWVCSSLIAAGSDEIVVLLNSKGRGVRESLRAGFPAARWIFLEADTRSSWESFRLVAQVLAERREHFLVSTVDALIAPEDIARFARQAAELGSPQASRSALLALTDFVDDEKPLWADLDAEGRVSAMGDDAVLRRFVTCGLYALGRLAANSLGAPESHGSLREFWISAVRSGVPVGAIPLKKTLDVDRPEDVLSAERFLSSREALC